MQVYKNMDIGTAKVTKQEMHGIPHHMIDTKEPNEDYSVAEFQHDVQAYINEIISRKRVPIIDGGRGLYIQAALYHYHYTEKKRDDKRTDQVETTIANDAIRPIINHIKEVDPEHAAKIQPNHHGRVIRELEIYEKTRETTTASKQEQGHLSPYSQVSTGLTT